MVITLAKTRTMRMKRAMLNVVCALLQLRRHNYAGFAHHVRGIIRELKGCQKSCTLVNAPMSMSCYEPATPKSIDRQAILEKVNRIVFNGHQTINSKHPCSWPLLDLASFPQDSPDSEFRALADRIVELAESNPNTGL